MKKNGGVEEQMRTCGHKQRGKDEGVAEREVFDDLLPLLTFTPPPEKHPGFIRPPPHPSASCRFGGSLRRVRQSDLSFFAHIAYSSCHILILACHMHMFRAVRCPMIWTGPQHMPRPDHSPPTLPC